MRRLRVTLLAMTIAAGGLLAFAGPAQASCETELGDMCHAYGVICRSAVSRAPALDKFIDCPNW